MPEKKTKVNLGPKNLAMLPNFFDYIFVHQSQNARIKVELSPKFLSTLGSNPDQTRSEPDPKSPAQLISLYRAEKKIITF